MDIAPVARPTARVLLLDEDDRVLLLLSSDEDDASISFWLPPGGGIEPGETARAAAEREVLEETGLAGVLIGPHIWNRSHIASLEGVRTNFQEVWFVARVSAFTPDTSGFTEYERVIIQGHRWWSVEELAATSDLLTPRNLAAHLSKLLDDGPPPEPVTIGR